MCPMFPVFPAMLKVIFLMLKQSPNYADFLPVVPDVPYVPTESRYKLFFLGATSKPRHQRASRSGTLSCLFLGNNGNSGNIMNRLPYAISAKAIQMDSWRGQRGTEHSPC